MVDGKSGEPKRREFFQVYDDSDFVIEVNTPFAALKREVLAAMERDYRKDHKCQAWRDKYCGMIIRIRARNWCMGCRSGKCCNVGMTD
jgi:hypothetical protein